MVPAPAAHVSWSTVNTMMWSVGMGWWMWVLMATATIGFWIVVVLAVRELFLPGPAQRPSATDEPLRLLDEDPPGDYLRPRHPTHPTR